MSSKCTIDRQPINDPINACINQSVEMAFTEEDPLGEDLILNMGQDLVVDVAVVAKPATQAITWKLNDDVLENDE